MTLTYWSESVTPLAANGIFTGTLRDMGTATTPTASRFRVIAFSDQPTATNGFAIEMSNDNTTWRAAATATLAAGVPQFLDIPIVAHYYRVKVTNGATLQGAFMVNSSISANQ